MIHNRASLALVCCLAFYLQSCKVFHALSVVKKTTKAKVVSKHYSSTTIPFEFVGGNIIVQVVIDHDGEKIPARLMLDTGAPSLLTENFVKAHNIACTEIMDMTETAVAGAAAEDKKQRMASNIKMKLGDIEVLKKHELVFGFDNIMTKCRNVDGFIGADVLSKFGMYLNFDNKTLMLYNKKSIPDSLRAYPTALHFKPRMIGKNPLVSFTVNGIDIQFIWDLGYTGSFMVQYPVSESNNFSDKLKRLEHVTYDTYGATTDASGLDTSHKYENTFIIKQLRQDGTTVSFPGQSIAYMESLKREAVHANMGTEFMKYFNVLIDWKSKKIFLKRNSNEAAGMTVLSDFLANYDMVQDRFYIAKVNTQSELYKSGLRAGQTISKMDGADINTLFDKQDQCKIRPELGKKLKAASSIGVLQGRSTKEYTIR